MRITANDIYSLDIDYLLVDFDHTLAIYRSGREKLEKFMLDKYSEMMDDYYKNQEVFGLEYDIKSKDISSQTVCRYIVSNYKVNNEILDIVKRCYELYAIDCLICTQSPVAVVEEFLDLYCIDDNLFIDIYSPENMLWIQKTDPKYFERVREKLECEPDRILLIDDNDENLEMFDQHDAYTYKYEAKEQYFI